MASSDNVEASALKALSNPLRMRLLTFVAERGEASPVEMSRALDMPLATVSHHTRVLRDLRYIELSRTEQRRGAVVALTPPAHTSLGCRSTSTRAGGATCRGLC
jgi:DNA-binding transcriptional ArsR family regulator